jgi:hypothetical protein
MYANTLTRMPPCRNGSDTLEPTKLPIGSASESVIAISVPVAFAPGWPSDGGRESDAIDVRSQRTQSEIGYRQKNQDSDVPSSDGVVDDPALHFKRGQSDGK